MATKPLSNELAQEAIDTWASHGFSVSAAERALGLPHATYTSRLARAKARGLEPQCQALLAGDKAAPGPTQALKGTSTLYGEDGKAKLQWVKTSADQEALYAAQKAALAAMCEEIKPLPPVKAPRHLDKDLATFTQ